MELAEVAILPKVKQEKERKKRYPNLVDFVFSVLTLGVLFKKKKNHGLRKLNFSKWLKVKKIPVYLLSFLTWVPLARSKNVHLCELRAEEFITDISKY